MKKSEFNIKGMHCKSCTMLVQDSLMETGAVKEAKVDLEKNKATITFDEKKISEKQLIDTIKKEGYDATLAK